jgi:hypothetical protein
MRAVPTSLCLLLLAGSPALAQRGGPPPRELVLEVEVADEVVFGEEPEVGVRFVNGGDVEVVVIRPCDGSFAGMRAPGYSWELERVGRGSLPAAQRFGRCGNVNPLVEDDFVRLDPSDEFALSGEASWLQSSVEARMPLAPGDYRIRLRYTLDKAQGPYRGGIPLGPEELGGALARLWNEARDGEVVSEWAEFEVTPPVEGWLGDTWEDLERISPGLPRSAVIRLADEPDAVREVDGREVLIYYLDVTSQRPEADRVRLEVTMDRAGQRVERTDFLP